MGKEVVAQFGKEQRQPPYPVDQILAVQALQHQAYGQVVGHGHRHIAFGLAGMAVVPQEHARPAGQLQRQALKVVAPVRLARPEMHQLAADGFNRIVRQGGNFVAGRYQLVEFPTKVTAGALPPGGVEAPPACRVLPGGHAKIEVRRQMANEDRTHGIESILAGETEEQ